MTVSVHPGTPPDRAPADSLAAGAARAAASSAPAIRIGLFSKHDALLVGRQVTTPWTTILCDDDWFRPQFVETALEFLAK